MFELVAFLYYTGIFLLPLGLFFLQRTSTYLSTDALCYTDHKAHNPIWRSAIADFRIIYTTVHYCIPTAPNNLSCIRLLQERSAKKVDSFETENFSNYSRKIIATLFICQAAEAFILRDRHFVKLRHSSIADEGLLRCQQLADFQTEYAVSQTVNKTCASKCSNLFNTHLLYEQKRTASTRLNDRERVKFLTR